MPRRRLLPLAPALFLLAGWMAACGGPSGQDEAVRNIVRRGNGTEPATLDPHLMTGHPAFVVAWTLFEGLTTLDPATLEPRPGVAQSWEVSRDGKTITFFLRPNARWSNGDPVKAGDFAFAWRRILSPGLAAPYASFLFCIEGARQFCEGEADFQSVGVETPDPYTLRVRLVRPTPHFFFMQAMPFYFPVHRASIEKLGPIDQRENPWTRAGNMVSNGAFLLSRWEPGRILAVRRNSHYHDAASVRIDGVDFLPIESLQTEERAFRTGRLDMTHSLTPSKIAVYKEKHPDLIRIHPQFGTYFFRFNTTRKPLDDSRIRRALAMSIDRADIVRNVARGGQQPADRLTPPMPDYPAPSPGISHDPDAARALLAEAGYPNGRGFPRLSLLYNTSEAHRAIAQAIQHMWKTELGIEIEILNQDWKVFLSTVKQLDYDIARGSWLGDYFDAMNFLELFQSASPHNRCGFSNARYDGLVDRALNTPDSEKRSALLAEAEGILLREAPIAPVYYYANIYLIKPRLQGIEPNAMDYILFRDAWLEAPPARKP